MFTEGDTPIVKYYPTNPTLKIHNNKNSSKLFLTTFQKRKKIRKEIYESKGKILQDTKQCELEDKCITFISKLNNYLQTLDSSVLEYVLCKTFNRKQTKPGKTYA